MQELWAAASPPPSKLNPPLSLPCPGSIQYGSSHDKLKVKVLTVFLVVTKKGSPVMLILTSAPCVKPPWWPCPPSAEAGTLSTLHTAAAPSDQQEPIWPHTSYKDDIGDKNNIYFQFRRGREEGRLTWFLLNFLFFILTTRMLATRRQYASWTKHIRDCTMTLDCLRGHRLIVVRCCGRVVCCFFCDPFICLNKSLSRVTPNITHPDPAAASSQALSFIFLIKFWFRWDKIEFAADSFKAQN